MFNVANTSFNAIRENKILEKISQFTVLCSRFNVRVFFCFIMSLGHRSNVLEEERDRFFSFILFSGFNVRVSVVSKF